MANTAYGLTALLEAVNHIDAEERALNEISDVVTGTTETVTYLDALDAGLIDDEPDTGAEDVEDEVDPDDPVLNKMLDKIEPTDDDEEVDVESANAIIESFIDEQ